MEYANLGDIVEIYLGITHTPEYVNEGVPFLSVKDISKGKIDFSNCKYISIEEFNSFPKGAKPQKGDILFCRVGTIGKPIIISEDIPEFGSFVSLGYLRLKSNDWNPEFIKYWMESDLFWKQVKQNTKGASQVNLNTTWLKKFTIPHYTIEKQNKIVKELNKIAKLISKNKIYIENFDKIVKSQFIEMLNKEESENWPQYSIGELYKFQYGKGNNIPESKGDYPCYGSNGQVGYHTEWNNEDAPIIGHIGAYAGAVVWAEGKHFVTYNGVMCKLKNKYILNPKFGYILLCNQNYLEGARNGAAQPFVSYDTLEKPITKLPPINIQNKFADFVQQIDKSKYFGGVCYGIC